MIKAHFEWNKLYIDISWMQKKYKVNGKKIKFILFYGEECLMGGWLEVYSVQTEKEIEYFGEDEIVLELDEVKIWYRWTSIYIWYYIEVNFWKRFLVFKDSKDIDISWRDNFVYYKETLSKNWKYNYKKDIYSYKKIIKNISNTRKIIIWVSFLLLILVWYIIYWLWNEDFWIFLWAISIITILITFFTAWRWYFSWEINKNIKDWNKLSNLISWKINNNLEELKIQLFAINSERWEYEVDSGSTTRTVNFNKTVWSILLHEEKISNIKAWTNIKDLLKWNIDFWDIYLNLFPQIKINQDYWLFLNLELRIISKNFKDINYRVELDLDKNRFTTKKWLKNNKIDNFSQSKKENISIEKNNNFNSDFFE